MTKKWFVFIITFCLSASLSAREARMLPDDSFKRLKDGNQRYVDNKPIHPDQNQTRREKVVNEQMPFAIIVGCSDSRVPPEIIFDQGLGDLFVVRVAGNVVGPIELDSIDFSADKLRTPLILVLGHENCGAVRAVLNNEANEDIADIAPLIQPAITKTKNLPGDPLANAIKANVQQVVSHLKSTPILSRLIKENKLKIVGGYYELNKGSVQYLP